MGMPMVPVIINNNNNTPSNSGRSCPPSTTSKPILSVSPRPSSLACVLLYIGHCFRCTSTSIQHERNPTPSPLGRLSASHRGANQLKGVEHLLWGPPCQPSPIQKLPLGGSHKPPQRAEPSLSCARALAQERKADEVVAMVRP